MSLASKITILKNQIKSVADKIRELDGSSAMIPPSEMPEKIQAIYDSVVPVEPKDYNFFDWDGKLLYAYSADEINALTELPPMPAHDGLVGKEWNYTLAQLQSLTQLARPLPANVGYIPQTPDGKSMLLGISIPSDDNTRRVDFEVPANNDTSATFDWGDGTIEIVTAANRVIATSHTYASYGDYDITITPSTATAFRMTDGRPILGKSVKQRGYLRKAVLGGFQLANIVGSGTLLECFRRQYNLEMFSFGAIQSNDYLTRCTVDGCNSLKAVHFPSWIQYINPYSVNATGAEVITIPYQVTLINFAAFCGNSRLKFLTLPASLTQIGSYPFGACSLKKLVFPDNTFTKFDNCLYKSVGFEEIILPNLTEIPASFYGGDTQTIQAGIYTPYMYIPPSITSFGSGAFSGRNSGIGVMDFRDHTLVPTLGNTAGVAALTYVVPDELYDEWIVATNWADKASAIMKASEYDD